jgi:hypothetical protein
MLTMKRIAFASKNTTFPTHSLTTHTRTRLAEPTDFFRRRCCFVLSLSITDVVLKCCVIGSTKGGDRKTTTPTTTPFCFLFVVLTTHHIVECFSTLVIPTTLQTVTCSSVLNIIVDRCHQQQESKRSHTSDRQTFAHRRAFSLLACLFVSRLRKEARLFEKNSYGLFSKKIKRFLHGCFGLIIIHRFLCITLNESFLHPSKRFVWIGIL